MGTDYHHQICPPSPSSVTIKLLQDHEDDGSSIGKPLLAHDFQYYCESKEDVEEARLQQPDHGTSSTVTFSRTCFNTTNTLSGIGILSMPYALSEGGWSSLALFFVVVIICWYTGLLIQRCMDVAPNTKTYPDIGHLAFGYKGRLLIAVFMYLELYLVAVSLLILEGDNLDKLFPNTSIEVASWIIGGKKLFVLLAALLVLPTTWLRNLGVLAYLSIVGVLASVILLGSLVWTGIADTGFHGKGSRDLNLKGLPMALGLYFVCFTSHAVFPTIYASMKEKPRFPKVLLVSFVLCTLNYGLVAVLGYLMYGDDIQSQVTLNLPDGKFYSKIAIYATLINPFTKYAMTVTPIAMAIEDNLPFQSRRRLYSLLIRTLLLFSTVIIALVVPFFGYIMAFTGSFLSIMVSVLMPCACYLRIYKRKSGIELVSNIGILVTGVLIASVGTYSSVRQIIDNI